MGSDNDAYFDDLNLKALTTDLSGIYISGKASAKAGTTTTLIANNGKTTVTLKWSVAENATGYYVYKKVGSSYKKIKTVAGTVNTAKATKLKAGTSYKFKIVTYAKYGTETYTATSKILTVKTKS